MMPVALFESGVVPRVSPSPYLSLIVPAYNEAGSIRDSLTAMRTFLDLQPYSYEVIVAADGDDGTASIVEVLAASWPNLQQTAVAGRHGKGHALRRGARLATGDVIGFLDADYKTPIDEVSRMLPWLDQGVHLVVGSRGLQDSQVQRKQRWYRQIGSRVFGIGMHAIVGLNFFRRAAAREIFRRTRIDGYMCDVEILWLAQHLGYTVREVGILWRDDGDSRLDLISGNIRNFVDLFRIRFGHYEARLEPNERPLAAPLASSQTDR
jgi:dolichyl-phosphate beta-glucosyltransferase